MFHVYPYQNNHELNLDWILEQLNSFRESFKDWTETIEELQEGLSNLNSIIDRVDSLENITDSIPAIKKSLDDLINLHDADINTLKSMIDNLQSQINNLDVTALKIYIDSHDNMLQADYNKKIYENYLVTYELFNGLKQRIIELAELVSQIDTMAYNPWQRFNKKESLQTNLNYAYADLSDEEPTASEYSELGLSADDYNIYDLSAHDYSMLGKIKLKMHYIFSPVFGFKQDINNVLTSIINFVKGTISADDYTALDLSADDYTAHNLNATDYYSFNSATGMLELGGDGITASQYSTITTI